MDASIRLTTPQGFRRAHLHPSGAGGVRRRCARGDRPPASIAMRSCSSAAPPPAQLRAGLGDTARAPRRDARACRLRAAHGGEQALANAFHVAELARQFETGGGISFRGFVDELRVAAENAVAAEAPILEEDSDGVR
jgi:hypothetical protein